MCPQFANLLQHQTALAGTLLHDTCWTQKYKNSACIIAFMRNKGTLTHRCLV